MSDTPMPVMLRVEPSAIPALRAAFSEAVVALNDQLHRLQVDGYIPNPWLGDEVSIDIHDRYNRNVMDATDGPYAVLKAFRTELRAVRDTLQRMEDEYRRTDGENAARWGRA